MSQLSSSVLQCSATGINPLIRKKSVHLSLGQSIILLHRSSIGRQTPSPENTKSKIGWLNALFCCRFIRAPHVNSSSLQEVKRRSRVKFLSFLTNQAINIGEDYNPRNNDSPTLSITRIIISASLKMAMYCPQGSGTLRQQLLMMHGIAWYCIVLHIIA